MSTKSKEYKKGQMNIKKWRERKARRKEFEAYAMPKHCIDCEYVVIQKNSMGGIISAGCEKRVWKLTRQGVDFIPAEKQEAFMDELKKINCKIVW